MSNLDYQIRIGNPLLTVLEYVYTLLMLKSNTFKVVGIVIDKRPNHSLLLTEVQKHLLLRITAVVHTSGHKYASEWNRPLT